MSLPITYNATVTEKLQRGTASAIEQMIQTCFPSHFGSLPLPLIWDKLHKFFLNTPLHVPLTLTTDDLVGFFNSVPQVRIAEAVDMLLFRFQQCSQSSRLMVNVNPACRQIKSISGTTKRAGDPRWWKSIDIQDVPAIVQVSFSCGIFEACGARWKQHDGTCIGNQISPILSSLPVLCTEIGWQRLFASSQLLAESFIVRYVDNRFIITPEAHATSLPIRTLVSPLFYGSPIELEDVGDDHFLGLRVLVDVRQIHFIPVSHLWQVRHPKSAGSDTHLLSGLRSRICTIRRYVWPAFLREGQVNRLKDFTFSQVIPHILFDHRKKDFCVCRHPAVFMVTVAFQVIAAGSVAVGFHLAGRAVWLVKRSAMPVKVDAEVTNILEGLDHAQRLSLLHHVTHPFLRGVLVGRLKAMIQEETDRLIAREVSTTLPSTSSPLSPSPTPPCPPSSCALPSHLFFSTPPTPRNGSFYDL